MSIGSFNEAYVVLNVRHSVDGSPDIKNSERVARISKIIQNTADRHRSTARTREYSRRR